LGVVVSLFRLLVPRLLVHGDRLGDQVDVFTPPERLDLAHAEPGLASQTNRDIPLGAFGLRRRQETRVLREVPCDDLRSLHLEHPDLGRLRDHLAVGRVLERLRQHREDVVDALRAELCSDEIRAKPRDLANADLIEPLIAEPLLQVASVDDLLRAHLGRLVLAPDYPFQPEPAVEPLIKRRHLFLIRWRCRAGGTGKRVLDRALLGLLRPDLWSLRDPGRGRGHPAYRRDAASFRRGS
jgi:hypothetical protein